MNVHKIIAVMTALAASAAMPAIRSSAEELPSGDIGFELIELTPDEIETARAASVIEHTDAELNSLPADFFEYGSKYGYSALSDMNYAAKRRVLYNDLLSINESFASNTLNLKTLDESGYGIIDVLDVYPYRLSLSACTEVAYTFQYDHPEFYWLPCSIAYSTKSGYVNEMVIVTYPDFIRGTTRSNYTNRIDRSVTQILDMIDYNGYTSPYEKVLFIHDIICANTFYEYGSDGNASTTGIAHSIAGILDGYTNTGSVCEGYAKAFQLLCNGCGVKNVYVIGIAGGGGHAWNMAQLDNGEYYYFDVTWDDSNSNYKYFAAGRSFNDNHYAYSSSGTGSNYLYDLPSVPSSSYTAPTAVPTATPTPTPTPRPTATPTPTPIPTATPVPSFSANARITDGIADISFDIESISDGSMIYAACYDSDNKLIRAVSAKAQSHTELKLDMTGAARANIYVWSHDNEPISMYYSLR